MSTSAPGLSVPRFARPVMPVVVLGGLIIAGWLWHQCYLDPRIRFLAPHSPAEWIIFPRPASFDSKPETRLTTRFRRRWNIDSPPAHARLTYRAVTRAIIVINGETVSASTNLDAQNWKSPVTIEVTSSLREGPNEISIAVSNESGPPALWAWLDGQGKPLITDQSWEASQAGSVWCTTRLASEPLLQARDGTARDFSNLSVAWQTRWPTLLGLMGLSALLVGAWPPWMKFAANHKTMTRWTWLQDPARVVLAAAIVIWIVLFWHNLGLLPRESGFDAPAHGDYIRYIMERHSLPLANEGGTMYNPPLYYLISAGLLKVLTLPLSNPLSAEALRGFALIGGIIHLLLIAGSLRLLFPGNARIQAIALLFAAALPPNLYLSHYVTNEWLVAVLVTGTIYLTLRLLRSPQATAGKCAAVGACLGAALLTKFTALLVALFVLGAVVIKVWNYPGRKPADWLRTVGALALTCGLVCGWHYARVWVHFGKPLVGSWEAASGFHWWQDQGYLTFSHFLGFGDALSHPAFSARSGFWDGLYSTLWADGLCGGRATGDFRPPWDYALMVLGSFLAIGPTLAILAGAAWSLWCFLRQPTPERLILNGLSFGFCLAFVRLDLTAPYYGELKAFYGLVALLPVCVFGAQAWDAAGLNRRWATMALAAFIGAWALTSITAFWIPTDAAQTKIMLGSESANAGRLEQAIEHYNAALKDEPRNAIARSQLASCLEGLGRANDARAQIEQNLAENPDAAMCHLQYALIAQSASQMPLAEQHIRQALSLAPDCIPAHAMLVQLFQRLKQRQGLITACRESLRVDPSNANTHFALGISLAAQAEDVEEARERLGTAAQLAPASTEMLGSVAWVLATHASPRMRDGALAVQLATQACTLTGNRSVIPLLSLAVAQAETNRFEEATSTALLGQKLASDTGQSQLAAQCGNFASWFQARRPFRQPPAN
jgi:tetratricopeptide (TPR) repeat protein